MRDRDRDREREKAKERTKERKIATGIETERVCFCSGGVLCYRLKMQKTIQRDTRSIARGKEKMVLVFIFPLFLVFLLSCSFPFEIKNKGRTMEMKGVRFPFPFGNNEKNPGDRARGGIC